MLCIEGEGFSGDATGDRNVGDSAYDGWVVLVFPNVACEIVVKNKVLVFVDVLEGVVGVLGDGVVGVFL